MTKANLKKLGQKARKTALIISVTALVSIGLTTGIILKIMDTKNKKEVPEEIAELEKEKFTVRELENMIESVSELVTEKYHYTDIGKDEKEATKLGSLPVPGTAELTLVVYSGIISAGIDVSEIECGIDDENKIITIVLPEPKIIAHEIDESSIESYDIKTSAFSKKSYADYAEKISEFKSLKEKELTADSTFFETVKENSKNALTTLLSASTMTKDYKIIFADEIPETVLSTASTETEQAS